jgi:hypothetical protein
MNWYLTVASYTVVTVIDTNSTARQGWNEMFPFIFEKIQLFPSDFVEMWC